MVPVTFCFTIPLVWCRRRSITSSWNLSTNLSWSFSTIWLLLGYQLNSWWEIPSLPSMNCIIVDHFIAFPPTQACSCLVLYLEFLAIQQLFFFTLEYYHLLCQECCENFTTSGEFLIQVILVTITILFLVTVLFLTTDKWTVMCNPKTSSNPIALKLMVGSSSLGYWLLNHHSDIGRATQPIFRAHLSTNV